MSFSKNGFHSRPAVPSNDDNSETARFLGAALARTNGSAGPGLRDVLRSMSAQNEDGKQGRAPGVVLAQAQRPGRLQPNTLDGYVPPWRYPPSRPPNVDGRRYWEPVTPHDMIDGQTGERVPFDGFYGEDIDGNNIPDEFDNRPENPTGDYITPRLPLLLSGR